MDFQCQADLPLSDDGEEDNGSFEFAFSVDRMSGTEKATMVRTAGEDDCSSLEAGKSEEGRVERTPTEEDHCYCVSVGGEGKDEEGEEQSVFVKVEEEEEDKEKDLLSSSAPAIQQDPTVPPPAPQVLPVLHPVPPLQDCVSIVVKSLPANGTDLVIPPAVLVPGMPINVRIDPSAIPRFQPPPPQPQPPPPPPPIDPHVEGLRSEHLVRGHNDYCCVWGCPNQVALSSSFFFFGKQIRRAFPFFHHIPGPQSRPRRQLPQAPGGRG